jgi:hypothetical protein
MLRFHSSASVRIFGAGRSSVGPKSRKLYRWRITRIRASPAALIGYVEAPDQEQAIKAAIREYRITNPEHQKWLAAQRRQ